MPGEMGVQGGHGADRQTGSAGKQDMRDPGEVRQQPGAGVQRGLDDAEAAPFARAAARKADVGQVMQCGGERGKVRLGGARIDMDDDRAAVHDPVPGQLRGAVQVRVAQHDDTQFAGRGCHAQFPFDIRPRTSSWRQLTYFSLQWHQRSRSRAMPSR